MQQCRLLHCQEIEEVRDRTSLSSFGRITQITANLQYYMILVIIWRSHVPSEKNDEYIYLVNPRYNE